MDLSLSASAVTVADKMPIDWKETPQGHIFEVNLPGVSMESINVEIVEGELEISAERMQVTKEGETWHHVESFTGRLVRRFKLPREGIIGIMEKKYEDGVLRITLPVLPRPTSFEINISLMP
ncbi:hypothetical protein KP509_20G069500 [Ceratopteris richardii]|uniref:SHSP domain-containing protein n=1 Tax=Ceratopteris richardii TaxID=49495 RepID=A0A8T2SGX8_CERRI|nr:hypothetical protein KP509_20G069500 [Ceratopteris richardii]